MGRPKGKKDSKPRTKKNGEPMDSSIFRKVPKDTFTKTYPVRGETFTTDEGPSSEFKLVETPVTTVDEAAILAEKKADEEAGTDMYLTLIHFVGIHPKFKALSEIDTKDIFFSPALGRLYKKYLKDLGNENLDIAMVAIGTAGLLGSAYKDGSKPNKSNQGYPSQEGYGQVHTMQEIHRERTEPGGSV